MTNHQDGSWSNAVSGNGGPNGHGGAHESGASNSPRRWPYSPTRFPHSDTGVSQADGEP